MKPPPMTAAPGASGMTIGEPIGIILQRRGDSRTPLPSPRDGFPGRSVRGLQGNLDAAARLEEQRHVREDISHGDRYDVGLRHQAGFVGGHGERLVRGRRIVPAVDIVPDRAVDAPGVVPAGGDQVEDEEVDAALQELGDLLDELLEGLGCGLVARRDDLDDRHDTITADVAHRDPALLAAVELHLGLGDRAGLGPSQEDTAATLLRGSPGRSVRPSIVAGLGRVQGQDVRARVRRRPARPWRNNPAATRRGSASVLDLPRSSHDENRGRSPPRRGPNRVSAWHEPPTAAQGEERSEIPDFHHNNTLAAGDLRTA